MDKAHGINRTFSSVRYSFLAEKNRTTQRQNNRLHNRTYTINTSTNYEHTPDSRLNHRVVVIAFIVSLIVSIIRILNNLVEKFAFACFCMKRKINDKYIVTVWSVECCFSYYFGNAFMLIFKFFYYFKLQIFDFFIFRLTFTFFLSA